MPESPQNLALSKLGAEKISGGTWRLFIFSFFVFLTMFVGYLGLKFGYGPFVGKEIQAIDAELEKLAKTALPEEQERFVRFYFQLINLEEILNNHTFASRFFPILEERTNQQVSFGSLSLSVPQSQATLSGTARDFQVFAQQLFAFQRTPKITKVNTQGAGAGEGGRVTFRLDLGLSPDIFR